ncbi:hypothetical protein PAHAL_9G569600 [Panicum hallii]|uniref:Uncharacterized protein n=1 Tax=Panicum hallii TaxID=206008 RepID=A0A2S3ITD6_9POAL|nr:hypothetical protein PAHAL_9G569600 [Panicum hallii]
MELHTRFSQQRTEILDLLRLSKTLSVTERNPPSASSWRNLRIWLNRREEIQNPQIRTDRATNAGREESSGLGTDIGVELEGLATP